MQFPTTYRHHLSGELFVATGEGQFGASSVAGIWVADGRAGTIFPNDSGFGWDAVWEVIDVDAEISRRRAYIAGRAGGTATDADVRRWELQLEVLLRAGTVADGSCSECGASGYQPCRSTGPDRRERPDHAGRPALVVR